jgi:hypothetical protein
VKEIRMIKKQELIKVDLYSGNDSIRDYHTRAKLIKGKPESSKAGTLGPIGKALYEISGVASVEVDRYSVVVERGQMFTWAEVEPRIKDVLLSLSEERPSVAAKKR